MRDDAAAAPLPLALRTQIERVAEVLGLSTGHTQLLLDFVDGHLRWWEPRHVRRPASALEAFDAQAASADLARDLAARARGVE